MLATVEHLTARAARWQSRRGFTLAEMMLALVLGGMVLGLVSAVGRRLQRQLAQETERLSVREQLAAGAELLPIDLRALDPGTGDITPGEARDTSLQLRVTIANALVCGGSSGQLILAPYLAPGGRSIAPAVQDGDTVWLLSDADSSDRWRPVRLRALLRTSGRCSVLTDSTSARVFDVAHLWTADLRDTIPAAAGSVARLTRPARYSFYRASDGGWYLGLRTWNSATAQFNTIQPISGPYESPLRGTGFVYFNDTDTPIPSGSIDASAIARTEALLLSEQDSLRVVVALRNRR